MSHDSDPLLRAIRDGDTACPDGAALAELGRRVRAASTPVPTVDLVPRVLARIDAAMLSDGLNSSSDDATANDDAFSDAAIDAFYDAGETSNEDIARLAAVIRSACQPAQKIDLQDAVRARLKGGSLRLRSQRRTDLSARFRIWSAVIAGHIAAVLAFTTWQANQQPAPTGDNNPTVATATHPGDISGNIPGDISGNDPGLHGAVGAAQQTIATISAPQSWQNLRPQIDDVFAPRRLAQTRELARTQAGLTTTAPLVAGAMIWLIDQQDEATGHFGMNAGTPARDLATQSLAVLALLGEGVEDPAAEVAIRRGLQWITTHHDDANQDGVAASLAALALVESAAVLDDAILRDQAATALIMLVPEQPGQAGLGGFTWLALQTAAATGTPVSGHAVANAQDVLGRVLPSSDDDAGRIGLAAFARLITGRSDLASTKHLLTVLGRTNLRPQQDATGRIDPLGTLFASWAMYQAGGKTWTDWAHDLRDASTPAFSQLGGLAWVPAERVRFADAVPNGDIFATAVTVLNLQTPYRTIR